MALPVIKYQPQRPGAGANLNDLPRSYSGNVPFGQTNAPKLGYNPPGAVPKPAPKPRPPAGTPPFPGEPTDPRYVGPPIRNPVPDRTPDYAGDRGFIGPPTGTTPPMRVNYNPSAPTNPPAGQVPMGQNPAGNPRGNNDPYGKTGPFIPVPYPNPNPPTRGVPSQGPFPPMPEPTQGGTGEQPVTEAPFDRTQETLAERLQRLRDVRAGGGGGDNLGARIHALNQRIAGGAVNPKNYDPNRPPQEPNDWPTSTATMKQGDLAELAPPVGYATFFRDQGKSAALKARKEKIKANAGVELTKKKKGGGGGGTTEGTTTDTAQAQGKNKGKLTDKQKKRLKRRPQPGTPERPYINRGVTYRPVGNGGELRV